MSGYDRWRRLRHAAMAGRVGVFVLLASLSAPAGFVCGPVGDAHAQPPPAGRVYRIGFLSQGPPPKAFLEALQEGLRERGYAEGRNLVWEFRSTDGSLDQLPQFAADMVRLKVDLILARASSGAMAAKRATTSIPIVFFAVYAPVEIGLVPNLAHPGGNITGVAVNASDMAGKRVELLKELVPTFKGVAILSHPAHPTNAVQVRGAEAAARQLGAKIPRIGVLQVGSAAATESLFEAFKRGMRERGYVEGQHVVFERRLGEARPERISDVAAELVRLKVDIIVTSTDQGIAAVKQQTRTIPIVMANSTDPVGTGFVATLARPGGNITGHSAMSPELSGKRLELLREVVPGLSPVAILWNPDIRPAAGPSAAPTRG